MINGLQNTKEYLQKLKDNGTDISQWETTSLAKLVLAIESIGYDPRDISSIDFIKYNRKKKWPQ